MAPSDTHAYATSDPRTIITPDAFSVSSDLVGTPLASPLRRLGAILIDLLIAGLFTLLGWYVLGVAVVFGAFRAAFFRKTDAQTQVYKAFKVALGCFGTLILIIMLVVFAAVFFTSSEDFQGALGELEIPVDAGGIGEAGESEAAEGEQRTVRLGELLGGLAGVGALTQATDSAEAHRALVPLIGGMLDNDLETREIREILAGFGPSEEPWWDGAFAAAAEEARPVAAPAEPGSREPVARADRDLSLDQAVARHQQWSRGELDLTGEERAALELTILSAVSPDTLAELQRALRRSQEVASNSQQALERAETALEESENAGLFGWVRQFTDDMGLLFGWGTVYLTVFTAWWDGRTVGKRLFKIRVVRLDGRPMTGWLAFERVGGYAAGFATGLLGFAQVYWDPNRMTIHDKIAETVVIREGMSKVPGPWSAPTGAAKGREARRGGAVPDEGRERSDG
jgi:hypothetical protein